MHHNILRLNDAWCILNIIALSFFYSYWMTRTKKTVCLPHHSVTKCARKLYKLLNGTQYSNQTKTKIMGPRKLWKCSDTHRVWGYLNNTDPHRSMKSIRFLGPSLCRQRTIDEKISANSPDPLVSKRIFLRFHMWICHFSGSISDSLLGLPTPLALSLKKRETERPNMTWHFWFCLEISDDPRFWWSADTCIPRSVLFWALAEIDKRNFALMYSNKNERITCEEAYSHLSRKTLLQHPR